MTTNLNYPRTASWRGSDHKNAREFEEQVGEWIGSFKVSNLESTDRLDWWIPGFLLDVKEKNQPLTNRWPLPEGCASVDAFILDELSIRKAFVKGPSAYFLMRDRPGGDRVFLARIDEVLCADRCRVNRIGRVAKGKWVLNLKQFRQLNNPAEQLLPEILSDQVKMPWKQSACLVQTLED